MIQTAWTFIFGCAIVGYLVPELLLMSPQIKNVPAAYNLWSAIAFALIAASFV